MRDVSHPPAADELPEVDITMNQVVAYNIAYFRKIRGLTQEELGKRLEPITGKAWSKATMSAVERSWSGARVRSFDADELAAFSQALGYPVSALLLPPEEDGASVQYRFKNVGEGGWSTHPKSHGTGEGLMGQLFISEYGDPLEEAYVERLQTAFDFYFGGIPEEAFFHNSRPEFIDEHVLGDAQVDRLKHQVATLRDVIGMLDRAAKKLESGDVEVRSPHEVELQKAVRLVDAADPESLQGARAREHNADFSPLPGVQFGLFSVGDLGRKQRRAQAQEALGVTRLFLLGIRVWPALGRAGVVDVLSEAVTGLEKDLGRETGAGGRLVQLMSRALWRKDPEEAWQAEAMRYAQEGMALEAALKEGRRSILSQLFAEWDDKREQVASVDAEISELGNDPDAAEAWIRGVWRSEIAQ
ncbi:helix-turn-helix domain-containing protein [Streptomyces griseus]|uniref:helix-turn-helix domain-containing protein n=1 Tax=Streptomyces griseus TaxID=1911 RepID=UPI00339EE965